MASTKINPYKTDPEDHISKARAEQDITEQLQNEMAKFCDSLMLNAEEFDESKIFELLRGYILNHERILYTPISNKIYACYDEQPEDADQLLDNMISNAGLLVTYSHTLDIQNKSSGTSKEDKSYKDTSKSLLKIWDHINLAKQQYSVLKQSDAEFQDKFMKKFNADVRPEMDKMSKDLNSQLLSMVAIFTALAFLIFGGISSLDNLFSDMSISISRLMILGSIWGLGIMNIVFVFLFCVGKMTQVNFKSNQSEDATIFQRYPVVWWCNYFMAFILALSCWLHALSSNNGLVWFYNNIKCSSQIVSSVGTGIIIGLFILLARWLYCRTKSKNIW